MTVATGAAVNSQPATFTAELPQTYEYEGQSYPVPPDVAPLFTPVKIGDIGQLTTRLVYPPLTRCRSPGGIIQPINAQYYSRQTQKGGLTIAEATVVAPEGHGYPQTPAIGKIEERDAWKPVTKAIRDKGGFSVCQLWHVGRASHPSLQPGGKLPVAPSAIAIPADYKFFDVTTMSEVLYPTPREITKEEIKQVIEYFRIGARNAIDAGFDGVEIHAGNGYLLHQFLNDAANHRTDEYGGPIENRARFVLEIVDAVSAEVGAGKVGIRLSPHTTFLCPLDSTPYATYTYLLEQLNKRPQLAYVHLVEARVTGNTDGGSEESLAPFRIVYKGTVIAAGGYTAETAAEAVKSGHADAVAIGRVWLANPDFPKRVLLKAKLNKYDRNTFYSPGPEGYIDYPYLEEDKPEA